MEEDDGFELNTMLHEFEGDVVEEGDRGAAGPAKNILDKRSVSLSEASLRTRAVVLPVHLQSKFRTVVCRHWMRGECHKGDKCEFLHKMVRRGAVKRGCGALQYTQRIGRGCATKRVVGGARRRVSFSLCVSLCIC